MGYAGDNNYPAQVTLIEQTDRLLGGDKDAPMNRGVRDLADRTTSLLATQSSQGSAIGVAQSNIGNLQDEQESQNDRLNDVESTADQARSLVDDAMSVVGYSANEGVTVLKLQPPNDAGFDHALLIESGKAVTGSVEEAWAQIGSTGIWRARYYIVPQSAPITALPISIHAALYSDSVQGGENLWMSGAYYDNTAPGIFIDVFGTEEPGTPADLEFDYRMEAYATREA